MNLGGLNWIDLIVMLALFTSIGIGFAQGMLRQVIGIAALYIATILGAQYYTVLGNFIRAIIFQPTSRFLNVISFLIIVIAIWSLISWLALDAYTSTKVHFFPLIDQLGGSLLALVSVTAMLVMVLPVIAFAVGDPWPGNEAIRANIQLGLETSRLVPLIYDLKPLILSALSPWLPAGLPSIFNL